MKGVICYYSGSGNTKLARKYLVENIKNETQFDLYDVTKKTNRCRLKKNSR